jgi:hypothetical protein
MGGNLSTTFDNFNSIAYGNGIYVATALSGANNSPTPGTFTFTAKIYTSSDLANWTQQTPLMTWQQTGTVGSNSVAVNFWNGTFVALVFCNDSAMTVATSAIYVSSNGTSWTPTYTGTDRFLNVNYTSNNMFLSTHISGTYDSQSNTTTLTYKFRTSMDGTTWTDRYSNAYAGSGNIFACSGNGTFWYNAFIAWVNIWNDSTSPNTVTSKLLVSSDGITWTERYTGNGSLSFARIRDTLAISLQIPNGGSPATTTGKILTSSDDGDNWTERYNQTFTGNASLTVGSNSEDTLIAWIGINNTIAGQFTAKMLYSPDGIRWTEAYNQAFSGVGSLWVGYANPYFATRIYVNNAGQYTVKILFAPNGDTWNETYSSTPSYPAGLNLAYRNSKFIAFGNDGNGHAMVLTYTGTVAISYSGTVRDSNGNPIDGATVSLREHPSVATTTAGNGHFKLTGITPGSPYTIKVSKEGYWPTYTMNTPFLPPSTHEFTMNSPTPSTTFLYTNTQVASWGASAEKGVLTTRALDGTSQLTGGFAGVSSTAGSSQHPASPYTPLYSDALGVFGTTTSTYANGLIWVLNADDGDTVTLNGATTGWTFLPQSFVCYAGSITQAPFYGMPTGKPYAISGVVKDLAPPNSPLAVAQVHIFDSTSAEVARPRTNEAGYYRVDLLAPGRYTVSVTRTGYEGMSAPDLVALSDTSPGATVDMYMSPLSILALVEGWNFISLPKTPPDTDIASVLADVSSSVRIVWGWDNQNQGWKKYVPQGQSNTLSTMEPGKGYWVYMDQPGTISTGTWASPSSTTIHLHPAWNLIGYLGTDGTGVSTALSSIGGKWNMVWVWDNGQWSAKSTTVTTLPPPIQTLSVFNQGKAYWIKDGVEADWTEP